MDSCEALAATNHPPADLADELGRRAAATERAGQVAEDAAAVATGAGCGGRRPIDPDSSPAAKLLALATTEIEEYYRDEDDHHYVAIRNGNGHRELIGLDEQGLRTWLADLHNAKTGEVIGGELISNALLILAQKCSQRPRTALHLRMARVGREVLIDLGTEDHRLAVLRGGDVSIEPPREDVLFRRHEHMRAYREPDLTASPTDLPELLDGVLNLPRDPGQRALFIVWLVTGFIPGYPRPMVVATGRKGSTKSTLFKTTRRTVDPSSLEEMGPPSDCRDLNVHALQNYLLMYGNLTSVDNDLAANLCRLVTGSSIQQRGLFTNADAKVYTYQRLLAINGIDIPIRQPDLLDRVVRVELDPPTPYRKEEEAWADFEEAESPHRRGLHEGRGEGAGAALDHAQRHAANGGLGNRCGDGGGGGPRDLP